MRSDSDRLLGEGPGFAHDPGSELPRHMFRPKRIPFSVRAMERRRFYGSSRQQNVNRNPPTRADSRIAMDLVVKESFGGPLSEADKALLGLDRCQEPHNRAKETAEHLGDQNLSTYGGLRKMSGSQEQENMKKKLRWFICMEKVRLAMDKEKDERKCKGESKEKENR